jgi:antirestriction protein ArdC
MRSRTRNGRPPVDATGRGTGHALTATSAANAGGERYAFEELVAELGSAFLCADLQITLQIREDHASYIHEWLKVPKDGKRAVFTAASHVSKAVDFLHGLQRQPAS